MNRKDYDPYSSLSRAWHAASRLLVGAWSKVWLRISVRGRENVPAEGPVLLVANHLSFLDPALVGTFSPRPVHFVARSTLAVPLVGFWLRKVGTILIDRDAPGTSTLRTMVRGFREGRCLCLFPEGTRSPDGRLGPFRPGLEFMVRRGRAQVIPVALTGTGAALPRGAILPRPRKCVLRFGTPWSPEQVLADGGIERLRATLGRMAEVALAENSENPTAATSTGLGAAGGTGSADGPPADDTGARPGSDSADPRGKDQALSTARFPAPA